MLGSVQEAFVEGEWLKANYMEVQLGAFLVDVVCSAGEVAFELALSELDQVVVEELNALEAVVGGLGELLCERVDLGPAQGHGGDCRLWHSELFFFSFFSWK